MENPAVYYADTHLHILEMLRKGMDAEAILNKLFAGGLFFALDAATDSDPEGFALRKHYAQLFPSLYLTAGLSPAVSLQQDWTAALQEMEKQLSHPKILAVGEIGLDSFHTYGGLEKQKLLFCSQIEIANALKLPIVVHNRESDAEILKCFREQKPCFRGILHCFSSDYFFAKQCLDLGFLISFSGNITYKNSVLIREAAEKLPLDALVAETDSPYLAPHPFRGSLNHPGNIPFILHKIAEIRNCTIDTLCSQIHSNLSAFFPSVHFNQKESRKQPV